MSNGQPGSGKNLRKYKVALYVCILLLICFSIAEARDNVVLIQTGVQDAALWGGLKRFLTTQGYGVSSYEAASTLEQQIQNANKINKERNAVLLSLELVVSSSEAVFIAVPQANKGKGKILEIDEVQGIHSTNSEALAGIMAEQFGSRARKVPLFASTGIDMPAAFLRIDCPKDKTREVYQKLADGLRKYFDRSEKNENERKSE
jgi:hypothetical protein